ncbi:hypothetical protein R3P38DRAFT_1605835 [Favolaschia claudopus]|uniref:Uncharacterized protein n=1 Tax=Favolaschia claudopus TaxID=2862362 RepID=A0AAW0AHX5_9AGAR
MSPTTLPIHVHHHFPALNPITQGAAAPSMRRINASSTSSPRPPRGRYCSCRANQSLRVHFVTRPSLPFPSNRAVYSECPIHSTQRRLPHTLLAVSSTNSNHARQPIPACRLYVSTSINLLIVLDSCVWWRLVWKHAKLSRELRQLIIFQISTCFRIPLFCCIIITNRRARRTISKINNPP